jgi:hypothetical protein
MFRPPVLCNTNYGGLLAKELHHRGMTVGLQQDETTVHTTQEQTFPQRLISRYADINWSKRSPYLSAADTGSCGATRRPKWIRHVLVESSDLKQRLCQSTEDKPNDFPQRVLASLTSRMEECKRGDGSHMNNVIVKSSWL